MDFAIRNAQTIKLGVHIFQAFIIFIAWCITIAYLRNADFTLSGIGWYFALCFLTWPALLYQTMTSRFPRSRKFAVPQVFAGIDVVYTILWLSAWASVAAIQSHGLCIGACQLSSAMIAIGFFVFLFFGLTSAISVYGVIHYRQHGSLPGERLPTNAAAIDPDREAFSTAPHDDYAPVGGRDEEDVHGHAMMEQEPYETASYGYSSPPRIHIHDESTTYDSSYGHPHGRDEAPPYSGRADRNSSYGAPPSPLQFPAGNY